VSARTALLVALALAAAGCAPGVVRTDLARHRWYELSSPHVLLYTDVDADTARQRVAEIESWRQALVDAYAAAIAPGKAPPAGRLLVFHFHDCSDLRPVWGDHVAAMKSVSADFQQRRAVLVCESDQDWRRRENVVHELAHAMNHHFLGAIPIWLEEGLATYFQTVTVEGGELVLGKISPDVLRARHYPWPVRELLALSRDACYQPDHDCHVAAWWLVHLLNNGPDEYRARFVRFLTGLGGAAPPEQAWNDAFAGVARDRLERDYRDHLADGRTDLWTLPYREAAPAAAGAPRVLRRDEVHDLWTHVLLAFGGRDRRELAARQIDAAERDLPGWTGAHFWRAVLAKRRGDLGAAEASLRRYAASRPDDARAWIGLVEVGLLRADELHGGERAAALDDLVDEVAQVQRRARTAAGADALAQYFAMRGLPSTGIGHAERAVASDPSCAGCEETYALLSFQLGRWPDAIAHQERAIALSGEGAPPEAMMRRLARYRAAAATPAR